MSSYETSSLTEIEALLDGLDEATSQEVYDATRGYSPKALAAVAASRADAAGGGGGGAGMAVSVLGPYTVEFDTAGLLADPGHELFSLAQGDWLLDAWVQVDTEFDIADPLFLVGRGTPADSFFEWNGWNLSGGQETPGEVLEYTQNSAATPDTKFTISRSDDGRRRDVPARAAAACTINAVMYPSGPAPAAGSCRVWALVATA